MALSDEPERGVERGLHPAPIPVGPGAETDAVFAHDGVAARTAKFIQTAVELAALPRLDFNSPASEAQLSAFLDLYRAWIIAERGMADSPEAWTERTRILLHCMAGASTIEEASELLAQFSPTLWGAHSRAELRREEAGMAIVFHEQVRCGVEGLICEMWPLIVTLTQLEFVAGGDLQGVSARVRNTACLPRGAATLLFGRPLTYDASETALLIPSDQLRRAAVARAADIPGFLAQFMRASVGGNRRFTDMRSIVANVIQDEKLRNAGALTDLTKVAGRLGSSAATIRRRLRDEGATFRQIREEVFDELAKGWLSQTDATIEQIAGKLGYSDSYSFRRAFRRRNGVAPLTYRRRPG